MTQFILLYKGPATPIEDMTTEQSEQLMPLWNAWMGKVGAAMADLGAPFAGRTALHGDGTTRNAGDLNGYSIIEAADITEATSLCDGHPFLSDGTAQFSVEIYELAPIPM